MMEEETAPQQGLAPGVPALLTGGGFDAGGSDDEPGTDAADDADDVPVAGSKRKRDGRAGNHGAAKRHRYTNAFKARGLNLLSTVESLGGQLQTVAERLRVSPGMLLRGGRTRRRSLRMLTVM